MTSTTTCCRILGAAVLFLAVAAGTASAEILDEKNCEKVMKDTKQAINDNPKLGDKAEKILNEVMTLAAKRCQEKQFKNAKELLELARAMVASD